MQKLSKNQCKQKGAKAPFCLMILKANFDFYTFN
ncbi:hypothetical protein D046_6592A, partial [Vibrio parahaemolyticus V-223/04]